MQLSSGRKIKTARPWRLRLVESLNVVPQQELVCDISSILNIAVDNTERPYWMLAKSGRIAWDFGDAANDKYSPRRWMTVLELKNK
jgi:hypothetical protein